MSFWRRLADRLKGRDCFLECDGCDDRARLHQVEDADFAMALIGLGAKMAKADGDVSRSEVRAFYEVFRPPPEGRAALDRAFQLATQTTLGFDGYARRLAKRFSCYPAMLEDVLDVEMRASSQGAQFHSPLDTRADDRVDARQHFC